MATVPWSNGFPIPEKQSPPFKIHRLLTSQALRSYLPLCATWLVKLFCWVHMKIVILNLNSSYTFFKLLRSTSDTTEFSTVVNCGTIIAIELQNISWLHMETLYPFPPLHQLRSTTACILPLFPVCFGGFTDMESHSVAICGWLLSLDTMFSKFIHVACISISFPFYHHVIFHCVDTPHFVYPFIRWWTFRSFPIFGYMNNFASIVQVLCRHVFNFLAL